MTSLHEIALRVKQASFELADLPTVQKNALLFKIATLLRTQKEALLNANAQDLKNADENQLDSSMIDRLKLGEGQIEAMAQGLEQIAALPDPVGEISEWTRRPSGIQLGKMRVPLGVVGMIYESRPNVTADAAALCLKSGNACILRGGSEAIFSNRAIAKIIYQALEDQRLPVDCVHLINHTDRALVGEMLAMSDCIDVLIPRGGKSLVKRVSEEAQMPVIKHLDGICHVFIDKYAHLDKARAIAVNAKTSRYGVCNAMETLLVHQAVAHEILPMLADDYAQKGVELRGCVQTQAILGNRVISATEDDWHTEYLAPVLSIAVLESLDAAIAHINHYGSHHTDSIVTEDIGRARRFLRRVDSSSVMLNASTRFADGFEYGLGAEIGISTDKIHARGPVGLHGLTSQKWIVLGDGNIR